MARFIGNVYQTPQGIFCIDPKDKYVSNSLVKDASYGLTELQRLSEFTNWSTRILILGGHIGTICIPISKIAKEVVVFEANPNTFELLKTNLVLNGCNNVSAYNMAVDDSFGLLDFVLNTTNSGGSKRLPNVYSHIYFQDNPSVVKVPKVALDDFLTGKSFDIIFMDIEGSEYFAMKGMKRLLSSASVLFMEFIPHHIRNVAAISLFQLIEPLKEFKTFIFPQKKVVCHTIEELEKILTEMMVKDEIEEGIIVHKNTLHIEFS